MLDIKLKIEKNKNIMTICAVFGCKSSNDKRRIKNPDNVVEVSFCRFPRDEKLRKVWLYLCGRNEDCKAKRLFVCIKHFAREDFVRNLRHELLNYYPKSSRKIKIDAIPTLFLPPHVVVPPRKNPATMESPPRHTTKPPIRTYLKKDKKLKKETIVQTPEPSLNTSTVTNTNTIANTNPNTNTIANTNPDTNTIANTNTNLDVADSSQPKTSDLRATQFEFIDHVVLAYLNRCRSRAGNINVGMPHYILKGKAEEAAVLLGAPRHEDRFHWIDKFKKKIAENDAKGIVLSSTHESLSISDIINDEWPKFAKTKGLDIGEEDSEVTLSALDEEGCSMQTKNVTFNSNEDQTIQSKEPAPECSRSINPPPVIEAICQDNAHSQFSFIRNGISILSSALSDAFLKHVMKIFVRRFNATWPQADVPDIILHARFREAALIIGSKIKNRNVWLCAFKLSIKQKKFLSETLVTEPNQSLDIKDIIYEEWPKCEEELFNDISSTAEAAEEAEGYDSEKTIACETNAVDKSEQNNIESSDLSIQTYEEARDCLNLLNNYALELGDLSALSLIKKVDSFLKSSDCEE